MSNARLIMEAARKMAETNCPFKAECMSMPISYREQFCGCYNEIARELNEEYREEE